jgi:SSS family solute:Na+ symporter
VFSLYTRWFHRWGLLAGWAVGMVYGTYSAYGVINPITGKHFGGSLNEIPGLGDMGYIALTAFVLNIVVAVVVTLVLNAAKVSNGTDATTPGDYYADAGDPKVDADLAFEDDLTRGEPKA